MAAVPPVNVGVNEEGANAQPPVVTVLNNQAGHPLAGRGTGRGRGRRGRASS